MSERSDPGPVTEWLRRFEAGDEDAARLLFEYYFQQIANIARAKAGGIPESRVDPEEVGASVFESLWRGAAAGRLTTVKNREELWWLMLTITHQKAVDHIRRHRSVKRGGEATIQPFSGGDGQLPDKITLGPEHQALYRDEIEQLLDGLGDSQLRRIAVHKAAGHTIEQIATLEQVSQPTVQRKLKLIRQIWSRKLKE